MDTSPSCDVSVIAAPDAPVKVPLYRFADVSTLYFVTFVNVRYGTPVAKEKAGGSDECDGSS